MLLLRHSSQPHALCAQLFVVLALFQVHVADCLSLKAQQLDATAPSAAQVRNEATYLLQEERQHPGFLNGVFETLTHQRELEARKSGHAPFPDHFTSAEIPEGSVPFIPSARVHAVDPYDTLPDVVQLNMNAAKPMTSSDFLKWTGFHKYSALTSLFFFISLFLIVGVVLFEMFHRRWADVDFTKHLDLTNEGQSTEWTRQVLINTLALVKPFCCASENSRGRLYFGIVIFMKVFVLFVSFCFTIWSKGFWDSFEHKKHENFHDLMKLYVCLVTTWIIVWTYSDYIQSMLEIQWREWMTKHVQNKWLRCQTFYTMQLNQSAQFPDNPDQRIQEDIPMFIGSVLAIAFGLFMAVGRLLVFLPILVMIGPPYVFGTKIYCPGWLAVAGVAYSMVASVASHFIGQKLMLFGYAKQRFEADFRYRCIQVRDHAESIALYHAEACESELLDGNFQWIKRVFWEQMLYNKRLGMFTSFYFQTNWLFPFMLLAPSYFVSDMTLGDLFQISGTMGRVQDSFDWFVSTYTMLASFRATLDRLIAFNNSMNKAMEFPRLPQVDADQADGAALAAWNVSVQLPGGRPLWVGADLKVRPGETVLLSAKEGSGKSCFFRAVAGIWPYVGSEGKVHVPEGMLLIPQKSYIPQGSLRTAIGYPHKAGTYSDEEATAALRLAGLEGRVPIDDLEKESNWMVVLSGGEQQRFAIARALLTKPTVLMLDEATSQIGTEGSREIHALLRKELPGTSIVSISHEVELMKPLHDVHYAMEKVPKGEGGTWVKVS